MAANAMTWLTQREYSRLKGVLAELILQSRGVQAGLETLEEILESDRGRPQFQQEQLSGGGTPLQAIAEQ